MQKLKLVVLVTIAALIFPYAAINQTPVKTANAAVAPVCTPGPTYAASVVSSVQGTLNDGSPVIDPLRTDPNNSLGTEDNSFFSLGKTGTVTLSFAGYPINIAGNDVSIYEITNGRDTYPEEKATIEVSQNGTDWVTLGTATGLDTNGISSQDLTTAGLPWIKFVRITDNTDFNLHTPTADGYDLDAVKVQFADCATVSLTKDGTYSSVTGEITYTIDWSVLGSGSVDNLRIVDSLPLGTQYVAGSADNAGVYDSLLATVQWNLGAKNAGDAGTVTFKVTVDDALTQHPWAQTVVHFSQGSKADLTNPVDVVRSDPTLALGVAESLGLTYDNPIGNYIGKFVSLGFTDQPNGGSITLAFDHPIFNGPGNDLKVFEITSGSVYPDEQVRVEVSNDNTTWSNVGVVVRDGEVDLGANPTANYVRVTSTSDLNQFEPDADSYDVDAVQALQLMPRLCSIDNLAKAWWVANDTDVYTSASTTTVINQEACNNTHNSISGQKFNDINNNGINDGGEAGIAGVTIYLDANDNWVLDGGEVSTVTDASGNYTFTNLPAGMYIVREVVQGGWTQTYPDLDSQSKHVVFISGFDITGKLFGNHQTDPGNGGNNGGNPPPPGGGNTPPPPQGGGNPPPPSPTPPPPSIGGSCTNCGDNNNGGGTNGGSGVQPTPPPPAGQVLGDSTTTPSDPATTDAGKVLGATELPRTGSPVPTSLIAYLVLPLGFLAFRKILVSK